MNSKHRVRVYLVSLHTDIPIQILGSPVYTNTGFTSLIRIGAVKLSNVYISNTPMANRLGDHL